MRVDVKQLAFRDMPNSDIPLYEEASAYLQYFTGDILDNGVCRISGATKILTREDMQDMAIQILELTNNVHTIQYRHKHKEINRPIEEFL